MNSVIWCMQLDYMECTERIGSYDVYRPSGSTRWNPTPEQLRILRELYYTNGIRSPTANQIQLISWKLSRYGKIEGKNVFYWFQNHKARQRQKKRLSAMNIVEFPTFHTKSIYKEKTVGEASSCKEGACSLEQMYAVKHQNVVKAVEEKQLQEDCMMNRHLKTLELFPTHYEDRSLQPNEKKSCCWRSCEIKENDNNPSRGHEDNQRDIVLDLCLNVGNKSCSLHDNWLSICE